MKAAAANTANCIAIRGVHGPLESARPPGDGELVRQRRNRAAPSARAGPTATTQPCSSMESAIALKPSGPDESRDRGGGFGQLLVGLASALGDCAADAVSQVLVEQVQRHRSECVVGGADLGEDVDAVFVVLDHLGDATHLP